jgi:hypothetical protein
MKPEKMSPEELAGVCQRMSAGETMTATEQRKALAHIAGLEAERDEALEEIDRWKEECGLIGSEGDPARVTPAHLAADLQKRDREEHALRERVKALEEDVADKRALAHKWMESAKGLHATLSAIRQRAGDREARRRVAETCAIMGGPSSIWDAAVHADVVAGGHERMLHDVADGLASYILGEGAEAHEHRYRADGSCECGALVQESPASAPTTAEAFATVRTLVTGVPRGTEVSSVEGERLLSLLERRTGAMAKELDAVPKRLAKWADEARRSGDEDHADALDSIHDSLHDGIRAALADAPPVFTLEEVAGLERAACGCRWRVEVRGEHERGCSGARVRESIAALRR